MLRAPVSTGINIPQASLLPITPANAGGAVYGLHPAMPELQNLFSVGKCAILCNVGALSEPITRAQYIASKHGGKKVPDNLFSHSDQQQQFMSTMNNAGLAEVTGWGGRLADKVAGLNSADGDADVDVVLGLADVRQRRLRAARCRCPPAATSASRVTAGARLRSRGRQLGRSI